MSNFYLIQEKLTRFIKKYYTNELIKGGILFFAIGLLYLIITLLIEYFLWLNQTGRSILFWSVVLVELYLIIRFVLLPIAKLFNLQKGISTVEAAKIIGKHFPEVDDKLLNLLQLENDHAGSELLIASVEQKAKSLSPIPFKKAISFKSNKKYLKYAAIPLLVILLFMVSGNSVVFSDSLTRVVNYKMAYEPPAPFQFVIENNSLKVNENSDFKLQLKTIGEVVPENVSVHFEGQSYFLQQTGVNSFSYVFTQPKSDLEFYLTSNTVRSKPYQLTVLPTPTILNFEMWLDYPAYTKKKDELFKNTGLATVPEGTNVEWRLKTKQTESVRFKLKDSLLLFNKAGSDFSIKQRVYNDFSYEITTSNTVLQDYERLGFTITVVKDAYPEILVQSKKDSLDLQTLYFLGQVSDDYGLAQLRLAYYPVGEESSINYKALPIQKANFDEFALSFPGDLDLVEGQSYTFYFEVRDNDAIRGGKITKSASYNYRKLSVDELQDNQLRQQNETIKGLNNSLDRLEQREKELEELSKTQKEKNSLNYTDRKKLENFLQRQKQQEQLMKKFNKQLQENLEEFQKENTEDDYFKEQLKERLNANEKELEKNEKLLKELEELADKIKKEELSSKLEELAKQQKNDKRSLAQIVELTKRYYVAKKAEKLQKELNQLAEKQEEQAKKEGDENKKEEQDALNKDFEKLQKEMQELQKDNAALKKPLKLDDDKKTEEEIKEDQQEASEELDKKENSDSEEKQKEAQENAQKSQKKAARKMKKLSRQMESSMMSGGGETMQEDAEMLRQILDNLVLFSFEQENLLKDFKIIDNRNAKFGAKLRKQNELRTVFEHVDDSLFALSLRQPTISETINKEITEVYFQIDKAQERLAENQIYQGVANQQYALTAANNLAHFLSQVLDNMQNQMSMGKGKGKPKPGMQLPDIIKSQQELNEMMKQQMQQDGKEKDGEDKPGEKEGDKNKGEKGEPKEGEGDQPEIGKGEKPGELGSDNGKDEMSSEQLYEIYKRQSQLRAKLEQMLQQMDAQLKDKKGQAQTQGKSLLRQMEQIEQDLLEKGLTQRTMQRMMQLEHQLLKLEKAALEQGEDNKRESETNRQGFNNTTDNQIPKIKQYFNSTEILNRQVLPLRQIYQNKVRTYFKKTDD